MSEQTTEQELSEFEKAELKKQEVAARQWIKIEQDEAAKRKLDEEIKNIGSLSDYEFNKLKQKLGF
jgi:hypothetical protein